MANLVKDSFVLMRNVTNLLNVPESTLKSYEKEENSPRHIFTFLKQRERQIKNHFTKKRIFNFIADKVERESLHVVNFERYILPVTYSPTARAMIINLKPFDVEEFVDLSPANAYALLVYAYCFESLVTSRVKVPDAFAKPIIDYMTSLFIKVFGKELGLLGIYASGIPRLKFLFACYILSAFFGESTNMGMFRKAAKFAPYEYTQDKDILMKFDYSRIDHFLNALSELKVAPGIKLYGFTAKLVNFFTASFLPAMEDLSRFISIMTTSDIKGSTVIRSFMYTYNEKAFERIMEISRKVFR